MNDIEKYRRQAALEAKLHRFLPLFIAGPLALDPGQDVAEQVIVHLCEAARETQLLYKATYGKSCPEVLALIRDELRRHLTPTEAQKVLGVFENCYGRGEYNLSSRIAAQMQQGMLLGFLDLGESTRRRHEFKEAAANDPEYGLIQQITGDFAPKQPKASFEWKPNKTARKRPEGPLKQRRMYSMHDPFETRPVNPNDYEHLHTGYVPLLLHWQHFDGGIDFAISKSDGEKGRLFLCTGAMGFDPVNREEILVTMTPERSHAVQLTLRDWQEGIPKMLDYLRVHL